MEVEPPARISKMDARACARARISQVGMGGSRGGGLSEGKRGQWKKR